MWAHPRMMWEIYWIIIWSFVQAHGFSTTVVEEGEDAIIECGLQTTVEEGYLRWETMTNGIPVVLAYDVRDGHPDCDDRIINCTLHANGSIQLGSVSKEDGARHYRCLRGDADGYNYYSDHRLSVLSKGSFVQAQGFRTTVVKEGEDAIIDCGLQTEVEEGNLKWEAISKDTTVDLAYDVRDGHPDCDDRIINCTLYANGSIQLESVSKEDGDRYYRCLRGDEDGYNYYSDHRLSVLLKEKTTSPPSIETPHRESVSSYNMGKKGVLHGYNAPVCEDDVDGNLLVVCYPPSGIIVDREYETIQCNCTDSDGLMDTVTFPVTKKTSSRPSIETSQRESVSSYNMGKKGVLHGYNAPVCEDDVDGNLPVVCYPPSGIIVDREYETIQCNCTDSDGLMDSVTFHVTKKTTSPPSIETPHRESVSSYNMGKKGVLHGYNAPVCEDDVDGNLLVVCYPPSGIIVDREYETIQCNCTDSDGLMDTVTFPVTKKTSSRPSIETSQRESVSSYNMGKKGVLHGYNAPVCEDDVDGNLLVVCFPPSGIIVDREYETIQCNCTDSDGLMDTVTFPVTKKTSSRPSIETSQRESVSSYNMGKKGVLHGYNAPVCEDDVDGNLLVVCFPPSGIIVDREYETIQCNCTDSDGLMDTVTFPVTKKTSSRPSIETSQRESVSSYNMGKKGVLHGYNAPVCEDDVDGNLLVVCFPPSGIIVDREYETIQCNCTDSDGLMDTVTFPVTKKTSSRPSIETSQRESVSSYNMGKKGVLHGYNAPVCEDDVDGNLLVVCFPPSGIIVDREYETIQCNCTDSDGLMDTVTFPVTKKTSSRPSIETSQRESVSSYNMGKKGVLHGYNAPVCEDDVDGNLLVVCFPPSGIIVDREYETIQCNCTDSDGLMDTVTFPVTKKTSSRPSIETSQRESVSSYNMGKKGVLHGYNAPVCEDDVDGNLLVVCFPPSGIIVDREYETIQCNCTDSDGLMDTVTFPVTKKTSSRPSIETSQRESVSSYNMGKKGVLHGYNAPVCEDDVDGNLLVVCFPPSGIIVDREYETIQCNCTDSDGLMDTVTFPVTKKTSSRPSIETSQRESVSSYNMGKKGVLHGYNAPVCEDDVDGNLPVVCYPPSGIIVDREYETIQCNCTDSDGLMDSVTFHVTKKTSSPPSVETPHRESASSYNMGKKGVLHGYNAPVCEDDVDGNLPVVCYPPSGIIVDREYETIQCNCTDSDGQVDSVTFPVTTSDREEMKPIQSETKDKQISDLEDKIAAPEATLNNIQTELIEGEEAVSNLKD
ncbi:uncharacterized protein [Apostichopus japonicus]|uniref:uncharacterized protein isoform X2 n=1 Tax=Stichopus japonicus TaxID=307972 RepID=UPI003AB23727